MFTTVFASVSINVPSLLGFTLPWSPKLLDQEDDDDEAASETISPPPPPTDTLRGGGNNREDKNSSVIVASALSLPKSHQQGKSTRASKDELNLFTPEVQVK